MKSAVETAPQETLAKKARNFYENTYGRLTVGQRITAGVALNVATGGIWGATGGLVIRAAGAAVTGHAVTEGLTNWAEKTPTEVKRFKRLHAWMSKNEKRKKLVARTLGVTAAAGTFLLGQIAAEVFHVSDAHAAGTNMEHGVNSDVGNPNHDLTSDQLPTYGYEDNCKTYMDPDGGWGYTCDDPYSHGNWDTWGDWIAIGLFSAITLAGLMSKLTGDYVDPKVSRDKKNLHVVRE